MAFSAGERLGHYEIVGELGKGGMGTVYRARDTRLGREVAIKVSSQHFNERFEREARVIASLNHPNICTLYDVGPNYLVMELIEGASPKGPLPVETVIDYARQMADALDYAHERAVTHRDLKPGNLKITPEGTLKVLDFGLAKVGPASPVASGEDSPTLTMGLTDIGVILGTASYMAPEQARGKPVDKRADIWSFGVVLYELATGKRLFKGEEVSDTLASVLKDEPDFEAVPAQLRPMLRRCLEKEPKKRLRDVADAMALVAGPEAVAAPAAVVKASKAPWFAAAALAATTAVALWAPWREEAPLPGPIEFQITGSTPAGISNPTVSPDGRKIAYVEGREGKRLLLLRDVASTEVRELADDSTNVGTPIWSPDSRWLVYASSQGKLNKVDVATGAASVLSDIPGATLGGSWGSDGTILFGNTRGVFQVNAAGGTVMSIPGTAPLQSFPQLLPDGRRFLFLGSGTAIFLATTDRVPAEKDIKPVLDDLFATQQGGPFQWVLSPTGDAARLLFVRRGGQLMAQNFNPETGKLQGEATPVAQNVAGVSASSTALAYVNSEPRNQQLIWIGKDGSPAGTVGEPARWTPNGMSLSPDGTRAAVVKTDGDGSDLWVLDLERGTQQRLTQGMRISNVPPLWSADGKHLVYAPVESGITIYRRAADASGGQEAIFKGPEAGYVSSLSKDGRYLLRMMVDILGPEGTGLVTLEPGKMGAGAALKFRGNQAHFSPDGKWIAYVETGGVFVTPFRGEAEGAKYPVSTAGGRNPQWSRDGKELYFQSAAGLMVAAMTGDPARPVGTPRLLHKLPTGTGGYDRTPDGRTLALVPLAQTEPPSITVVLNWQTALPRGLASPRP